MAVAFVNGTTGTNTTTPTTATAFAVTAGNSIVVELSDDSGITTNSYTVTDTAGNTYTQRAIKSNNGTMVVYTAHNITGNASNVISVAWNTVTTGRLTIVAQQFSGTSTSVAPYGATIVNGSSTAPSVTSGASMTANDFAVGLVEYSNATATTTSLGTGYTNLTKLDNVVAAGGMESKLIASTATQTAAFTLAATQLWIAAIVALPAAGGAGPTTPKTLALMGVGS